MKLFLIEFYKKIKRFRKVVIWGLKTQKGTYRYIHGHFYTTLKKLNTKVVWVDDEKKNDSIIEKNDLVLSVNIAGYNLPLKKDVYYCLHNFNNTIHNKIKPSHNIRLQVYTNAAENVEEKWDEVTFFDKKTRILYQSWGANLLPWEFKKPVFNSKSPFVFWIGSVWNNKLNQGNIKEIIVLKDILSKEKLKFIHLQNIPDLLNIFFVRMSRIAPAIAGKWQVDNNYLSCRMFKNISYGQLGMSNVKKFHDLFKRCSIKGNNIEELIENSLGLNQNRYTEMTMEQQEIVKKQTYLNKIINICTAFERIES